MVTTASHPRYTLTLAPITQADFVGGFSLTSFGIFSVAAFFAEPELLPPKSFYILLTVAYLVLWGSFYIVHITRVPGILEDKTNRLIWMLRNHGQENIEVIPPDKLPRFWSVPRYARTADARWPRHMAIRVQLLALAAIVLSAWFTCYSGGPFQSPFAQILLALPLMSPNIASSAKSVLSVYVTTTAVAFLFEFFGPVTQPLQPTPVWFISTTVVVLLISGFVSTVTKRTQYQTEPRFRDLIGLARKLKAQGHALALKGIDTVTHSSEVEATVFAIVQEAIAEAAEFYAEEADFDTSPLSGVVDISRTTSEVEVTVKWENTSSSWVPSTAIRQRRATLARRVKKIGGLIERDIDGSSYRVFALLPDPNVAPGGVQG